jgi:hypothetical protein
MEAGNLQDGQLARWRPRRAEGKAPVSNIKTKQNTEIFIHRI